MFGGSSYHTDAPGLLPIQPSSCPPPPPFHPCPAQFVLTTDPAVGSLTEQLQYIYSTLFLDYVVKNPLYTPGEPFL